MAEDEAPGGLQLDLVSVVARLRQIRDEGGIPGSSLAEFLWDRVMTCDLPRLENHLTPATVAWMKRQEESWRR